MRRRSIGIALSLVAAHLAAVGISCPAREHGPDVGCVLLESGDPSIARSVVLLTLSWKSKGGSPHSSDVADAACMARGANRTDEHH